jgi:hypothetical protein
VASEPNQTNQLQCNQRDLGDVQKEYRVSRVVAIAAYPLALLLGILCLGGIMATIGELSAGDSDLAPDSIVFLFFLSIAFLAIVYLILAAQRARFAVYQNGILSRSTLKTEVFQFGEIQGIKTEANPVKNFGKSLNPLKPHLVITFTDSSRRSRRICPFLISNFEIFDYAISAWEDSKG